MDFQLTYRIVVFNARSGGMLKPRGLVVRWQLRSKVVHNQGLELILRMGLINRSYAGLWRLSRDTKCDSNAYITK
ncbi:hypothetical protein M758_10G086700 [Ceratodon purpureus]|nr:hypothetical protein M758_10G086700 [Ceratodon purpureus]